jgi:hypothetical protein
MYYIKFIGFEVITGVTMKSSVLWDIAPCSPVKVNLRFGCCLLHAGSLLGLLFNSEDGGDIFLRNIG